MERNIHIRIKCVLTSIIIMQSSYADSEYTKYKGRNNNSVNSSRGSVKKLVPKLKKGEVYAVKKGTMVIMSYEKAKKYKAKIFLDYYDAMSNTKYGKNKLRNVKLQPSKGL